MSTSTTPSITYKHGRLWEGDDIGDWHGTLNGSTGDLYAWQGDFFLCKVTSFTDDAFWTNGTPAALNTELFKKGRFRYRTTGSAKAKIVAHYSDSTTQTLLSETASETYVNGVAALTAGKILNFISLYCCDGEGEVYYDFVLIYGDDFVFPNIRGGFTFKMPIRDVVSKGVGQTGGWTDSFGSDLAEAQISCDLSKGTWKRSGDALEGEVFMEIADRSGQEKWQWFDSGHHAMKVRLIEPSTVHNASPDQYTNNAVMGLREFRLSDVRNAAEDYRSRWGLH